MRKINFPLMLFIVFPCGAFAEKTFFAFVPDRFTRVDGPPRNVVREFSVQDVNRKYRLEVHNKSARGMTPSAVIKLNGRQIVDPNAFERVNKVSVGVNLSAINTMEVEVRSEPGTSVIVRIVGTGDDPTSHGYPVAGVTVRPGGFPVNTPTEVIINFEMQYDYDKKPWPVVELIRVDEKGAFISTEGVMLDNGNLANGDEIESDRVFSFRKTYNVQERSYIYLRVRATVDGKMSLSETFNLNVYEPLTKTEIETMLTVNRTGSQLYMQLRIPEGEEKAIAEAVNYYKSQSIVKEVRVSASSVSVKYTNGITGGFLFCGRPGTRRECR
jgi:hypothetical protein